MCYPPEYFRYHKVFPTQLDIWSLGLMLFLLIAKEHCFDEDDIKSRNFNVDMSLIRNENVSEQCADLVHNILNPNPDKRYTMDQILNSSWLNY